MQKSVSSDNTEVGGISNRFFFRNLSVVPSLKSCPNVGDGDIGVSEESSILPRFSCMSSSSRRCFRMQAVAAALWVSWVQFLFAQGGKSSIDLRKYDFYLQKMN